MCPHPRRSYKAYCQQDPMRAVQDLSFKCTTTLRIKAERAGDVRIDREKKTKGHWQCCGGNSAAASLEACWWQHCQLGSRGTKRTLVKIRWRRRGAWRLHEQSEMGEKRRRKLWRSGDRG
ncbi:hypothetical protein PIB30_088288 [Stylosanthes scabra]|uniref:Uncharacterized protein n=1 Tax=Stylosanthes scabra TaxID=79078 RepID=A0ABU6TU58_9FABA|nr:hypothetical protein [Stylosanthes scabra]